MKKSVTESVRYIQDNLPVLIRGAFGIFNELLPEMKKGIMENATTSFELREYLEKTYTKDCGIKPEEGFYKDLPFSCMMIGLSKEKITKAIRSLNKLSCSVSTKGSDSGEILSPIYAIRLSFLSNSEMFRASSFVPEIHVSPRVQFSINTKRGNSGSLNGVGYDNWLPKAEIKISPTGGFSNVSLIDYIMMIDIDSLYKTYVTKSTDVSEEHLINRIVGSACLTYLAAVSNSVMLYESALSELVNPIGGILDEAFLEYNDLDAPVYNYQDKKVSEPHWIRLTVSKVSSIIDAVVRYDSTPYSENNNVVGYAMSNLIKAYFAKKYAVSNTVYTQIGNQQILLSRLAEKTMEQIEDPIVKQILKESLEDAKDGVYMVLRDSEDTNGYFAWRDNVVKMLQKTLILVAYSGILINAVSGLDRKYDQFNNIFGRKGGYKGMVKKMVSVLWEHLDEILDKAVDHTSDGYMRNSDRKFPINKWEVLKTPNRSYTPYQDKVKILWTHIKRSCRGFNEFIQVFCDEASLFNMVADDTFGLSTNTDWDCLQDSLVKLHTHLKSIQTQTGENPQYRNTEFIQLNEQARDFSNDNSKAIRVTSLEAFEAAIDEVEQEIGAENEFGSGMYSPVLATVNQCVHGANALEDETQDLMNVTITEKDPENIANERLQYIQKVNVALERFDNLFYKLIIG